jgi:YggT family protein
MFARLIVDIVTFNNSRLRAKPVVSWIIKITWGATEPLLKAMRKVIPNIQFGAVGIDLSWAILMLLVSIASSAVRQL